MALEEARNKQKDTRLIHTATEIAVEHLENVIDTLERIENENHITENII